MKWGLHWFIFVSFPHTLFSWLSSSILCGYFGCISVCALPVDYDREGLLNAIETSNPNLEEESKLDDSDVIVVSWD